MTYLTTKAIDILRKAAADAKKGYSRDCDTIKHFRDCVKGECLYMPREDGMICGKGVDRTSLCTQHLNICRQTKNTKKQKE